MLTLVLGLSTLLQYVAAGLALRLVWITRRRAGWILIASAVLLMAVRRSITLSGLLLGEGAPGKGLSAELVALGISILMVAGISFIAPYFREIIDASLQATESERRLQAIIDNTMAVIYVKDIDGRFTLVNRRFMESIDPNTESVIGRTDHDLFPPESADVFRRNDERVIATGEPMEFEESLVDESGQERIFISQKFPLRHEDGQIYAICGSSTDITERVRVQQDRQEFERRILHTQKLESLGLLAGGIAHDFNNLLVPVMATADLLSEKVDPETTEWSDLDRIRESASRAAELCGQLLAYSGRGRFHVEYADLSELVRETVDLLHMSVQTAQVEYDLATDLPPVEIDVTQMRQVVMNLATNAAEAVGERPNLILISTGIEQVAGDEASESDLVPGEYVFVEVSDTGRGMDEETRACLFDPFYTTKFTGRGLGLAAVQGIVTGHGGAIHIESVLGQGSSFRVLLPSAVQPQVQAAAQVEPSAADPAVETILVVDDEDLVRRVACRILESAGLRSLEAGSGAQAIELYREHRDQIDAVLLDLTMPGTSGVEVMESIRALDPDARIVFMSGYNEASAPPQELESTGIDFLQKPFRRAELLALVTRAPEPQDR